MSENHDHVPETFLYTQSVFLPADGGSPFPQGTVLSADPFQTQYYAEPAALTHLGRYVIEGHLGRGGFGIVYRARDDQLQRAVAVKVPHAHRVGTEAERRLYLSEAQMVAQLDHPGVVQVFDFGVLPDGRCFVVSKIIEGQTLAELMAGDRLTIETCMALLISVAETLFYIHSHKLIHRDIKPSNLLLDHENRIYVADFGLALPESEAARHQPGAGTPHYMSPEQAGGEGHRIDFRSDLYSLGAVMYEMLTGRRPIQGDNGEDTRQKLISQEPLPLVSHDPSIPPELSRICLKLLSKRASDRYQSGQDLAADLKHFLHPESIENSGPGQPGLPLATAPKDATRQGKFVPRGLRAYDRHDAYFFLQLLPGPFDRDGLPESLSHWQRWVEHPEDAPELHRIGVIAGPSGCGKSSLIRAGLLPLLDKAVVSTLTIEASIDRTESQLADALDARFPVLATELTLTDKLKAIRQGQGLPAGRKLLIVIDQFEQWLHTVHERERPELIRALRQCDGQRVQCIVLVRDDFWMALNRFMEAVEAPLTVGQNVKLVDLFNLSHARNVLTKFGRAFDRIPAGDEPPSLLTQRFIEQAVQYLAKDGKVFPVHLSLFAEMVKGRDWVPGTLQQLGGAVGIGVQFLRESFSADHAPMGNRLHEDAVRHVLEGLLPEVGTQIKTRHRTLKELQDLSGYGDDTKRFERLLSVLEGQLKLISPVEAVDHSRTSAESRNVELHYQLSHDFLVPSIREWLYSEQRKTYTGRCRLMLAEQTLIWVKQPTRRNLPLWREWIQYRCLLRPASLHEPERRMLAAANQHLGLQTILGLFALVVAIVGAQAFRSWSRGHALIEQLHTASVATAPAIIDQLQPHRRFTEGGLNAAIQAATPGSTEELILRLAQLRWDASAAKPILESVLDTGDAPSLLVVRRALLPHRQQCVEECWLAVKEGVVATSPADRQQRAFRAALLLAQLDPPGADPTSSRWNEVSSFLCEKTVDWALHRPDDYRSLVDGMRPLIVQLTPVLSQSLGEPEDARTRSKVAFLRAFHEGEDQTLTLLLIRGLPWQWDDLRPAIKSISPEWLRETLATPRDTSSVEAEIRWERRLSAAAAILLSISPHEKTWDILQRSPYPGLRSQLIDRMATLGVKLSVVEDRLGEEAGRAEQADPGILSGLLLALGQYPAVNDHLREMTRQQIRSLYETHSDSGVHSAADWLMRHCQLPQNTPLITTEGIAGKPGFQWRLTPEGHLMIRLDGTQDPEIRRVFEICATEVTVKQFQAYQQFKWFSRVHAPTDDCPINIVKWPEALLYCDWLSGKHGLSSDQLCCPPGDSQETPDQRDQRLFSWGPEDDKSYYDRKGYRLPTRAEWAFACRAGSQTRWYFGNDRDLISRYEWHYGNANITDPGSHKTYTASHCTSLLKPNDLGMFDMYGNVREWCADGPSDNRGNRFIPGGSHQHPAQDFQNTNDNATPTNTEFNSIGLRIARTISDIREMPPAFGP